METSTEGRVKGARTGTSSTRTSSDVAVMRDDAVRWERGSASGHVESHFLKANSPDGTRAVWFKQTLLVPAGALDRAVCEAWAIAFERAPGAPFRKVGVKTTAPIGEARFEDVPFHYACAGATLELGRSEGQLEDGGRRIEWSLAFDPVGPSFHGFPLAAMYRGKFPKQKLVTPCPDARFDGFVRVDGEEWKVDAWPGMQGHNWGRGHSDEYAWVHCNAWDAAPAGGAWFEGFSGRVKIGPVMTPWITMAALHVEGETVRFDGARALLTRDLDVDKRSWRFRVARSGAELSGIFVSDTDEMVGLHYGNPDGQMTYCLNSKLARGELRLRRPGRPDLHLTTDRAALEIGTRDASHGVAMLL